MTVKEMLLRWNDFYISPERAMMDKGLRYFSGENDITLPENGRYDTSLDEKNLDRITPTRMSDRRIAHNFFKFIIGQQMAYGLTRKFVLTTNAVEELERTKTLGEMIKAKIFKKPTRAEKLKERFEAFNTLVSKTFGERYSTFLEAETNAPKMQVGWIYIFYNENNELDFKSMNPLEMCPVFDDRTGKLIEMIRRYRTVEYNEAGRVEVEYLEDYAPDMVYRYKMAGEASDEPTLIESIPYFVYSNGAYGVFQELPFVALYYNAEKTSLLQEIKPLIDAYDKIQSEVANNVIDIPNSLTFVSGFDGTNSDEVDAFCKNVKAHRFMFGPEGSDAKGVSAEQNIEQIEYTLTRLRKDIFEIGGGVDVLNKELKDTSGVALRWSYSDLEQKFNIWSSQIEKAVKKIIRFINFDNVLNGGQDFSDIDYEILYDTDSIINESETINNLVLSKGIISAETLAANHPYTKNADYEIQGMKRQMEFENELQIKAKQSGSNQHNTVEKSTGASI